MNWAHRYINVFLTHIGLTGRIGIGFLVLSLIAYLSVIIPMESRLARLQFYITTHSSNGHSPKNHTVTTAEKLETFYKFFPSKTSAPDWLDIIFNAARQQHLELPQGKYRARHEHAGPLIRYQITLPVTGSYTQVHRFLANILTKIPNSALDGVTFERQKIGDALVAAKIKISLYLGQKS